MAALEGSLEGMGLPALVRFLAGMKKTGRLQITHGGWGGELGLDDGRVVAATLGAERGPAALDGIALALARGRFRFDDGPSPEERNVALDPDRVLARLTEAAAGGPALATPGPGLAALPTLD